MLAYGIWLSGAETHYGAESVPPQVKDTSRKTKVFDYEIPIRVDGKKGSIDGTLYWVGQANTSKLPFIVVGLLVLLGGGAAVLFARRRRDRDDDRSSGDEAPSKEAW
jgi:LPXTG-motif cell wall-anchored protein